METFTFGNLSVRRYSTRQAAGEAAGRYAAERVKALLGRQAEANILFAAAPSQNEMLMAFIGADLDFSRINALHMDEYIGLPQGAPQRFSAFLDAHAFSLRSFRSIHYIGEGTAGGDMAARYAEVLRQYPLDVGFIGIGENGHIAFNDPHEANFHDPDTVRVVRLDEVCRQQQVNEGAFELLQQVPRTAVTVTIPAIMAAPLLVCTVPGKAKAEALRKTAYDPISEACPATILRTHPDCRLFCDTDSGAALA